MQPTMCSRCHKHVAVVFITKLEGGQSKNEGLCLKCAKELGIKPIDDMIQKMGITDEQLEDYVGAILEAQSVNVDIISGATVDCQAIGTAIGQAFAD